MKAFSPIGNTVNAAVTATSAALATEGIKRSAARNKVFILNVLFLGKHQWHAELALQRISQFPLTVL